MPGGQVELTALVKAFDDTVVVDGIDLHIGAGEFFSLLGPSGCGKTTTLRMIAGFERPTSGQILLDGHDMALTPPHKRNVNTVFQQYALFPHLTIVDNVAFGLRSKKVGATEARKRAMEMLDVVKLVEFAGRKPNQLSGGQQQRVAIARALVTRPSLLIADEPTGNLDSATGEQVLALVARIRRELGVTVVVATHDAAVAAHADRTLHIVDGLLAGAVVSDMAEAR